MPQPVTLKKLKLNSSMKIYNPFKLTSPKAVLFIIGDWNAKVGSQETPGVTGKFEVVKQEMARMNIDSLGISELKWTGMGEFNSDDHYIYYRGQESLRRNGVAITVNNRV